MSVSSSVATQRLDFTENELNWSIIWYSTMENVWLLLSLRDGGAYLFNYLELLENFSFNYDILDV